MKTITINILAEDIRTTDYFDSKDCAITRALSNAGRPDLKHYGSRNISLKSPESEHIIVGKMDKETYNTIISMYRYMDEEMDKYFSQGLESVEPRDFDAIITLTEESE